MEKKSDNTEIVVLKSDDDYLLPDIDVHPGEVSTEYLDINYTREDGK